MAKILLAEDDSHTIRILSLWLGRNGHETIETRNGAAAYELLRRHAVEMLISDVNMPELNGIGLVEKVRRELKLAIPIIVLSSRCDQAMLAEKFQALGAEVFPKPFVPSRLVANIERLLRAPAAQH